MMKENKNSRIGKFFETLIYTILMTLPIISVFVRSIYVQSNPNAKDSYSGAYASTQFNYLFDTNDLIEIDDEYVGFVDSNVYLLDLECYFDLNNTQYNQQVVSLSNPITFYTQFLSFEGSAVVSYLDYDNYSTTSFSYYPMWWQSSQPVLQINDIDSNFLRLTSSGTLPNAYRTIHLQMVFEYKSAITYDFGDFGSYTISRCPIEYIPYRVTYIENTDLDNAFEYSIQKVVNDYGKGNINFVNWLGDLFFNNTNNLLYFNFVNLYLNYALVVSVAYLLWFVLNWMIKFVKSLLNSFLPKGDN